MGTSQVAPRARAALAALTIGVALWSCGRGPRPTIVMVIWDTTRADHLTPYRYTRDTTPNLAGIAERAVVFERAFAAAPWTPPSVASLFTGLYVHNHGVSFDPAQPTLSLRQSFTTLAEALATRGYRTALYTSQGIFLKPGGFEQGFDQVEQVPERALAARGLDFLDRRPSDPAFLVLYWLDPHAPYEPRESHRLWSEGPPSWNIGAQERPGTVSKSAVNSGEFVPTAEQWDELRALYDGELHQNDADLGELWAGLVERGLDERILFVFTADHGEELGDDPRRRVWHELPYESVLHVPLLLRMPRELRPARVATEVRNMDLYPTLLELAGAPVPAVDARSLLPVLRGDREDRELVGATHYFDGLVFYRGRGRKYFYSRGSGRREELYDLATDDGEHENLARARPELARRARARLEEIVSSSSREEASTPDPAPISEAERESLRALGYLD